MSNTGWAAIQSEGENMTDAEKAAAAKKMDESSWTKNVREADNEQAKENRDNPKATR
jgi:hypothetical protein